MSSSLLFVLPHLLKTSGMIHGAKNLAIALKQNGFPVSILSLSADENLLGKEFANHDIQTYYLPIDHTIHSLGAVSQIVNLCKTFERLDPEVVVVWNPFTVCRWATIASSIGGWPTVLEVRNTLSKELHSFPEGLQNYVDEAIQLADYYLPVSRTAEADLIEHFSVASDKIQYIPNAHFRQSPASNISSGEKDEPVRIATVGRIAPQKNTLLFVQVAGAVAEKYPDTEFVIVGDEDPGEKGYVQQVYKEIDRLGLSDKITITGWLDNVEPWLDGTDIFVQTSDYEGASLALRDAMVAGCAVVSTNTGDAAELIGETGAGKITEVGDQEGLQSAIVEYISNPEKRREAGKKAREVYERYLNPHAVADKFMQAIEEVPLSRRDSEKKIDDMLLDTELLPWIACPYLKGKSSTYDAFLEKVLTEEVHAHWASARDVWHNSDSVILYGKGQDAQVLKEFIENEDISKRVIAFWDDKAEENETHDGIPVMLPQQSKADNACIIIASSGYYPQMQERLDAVGYKYLKDYLILFDLAFLTSSSEIWEYSDGCEIS